MLRSAEMTACNQAFHCQSLCIMILFEAPGSLMPCCCNKVKKPIIDWAYACMCCMLQKLSKHNAMGLPAKPLCMQAARIWVGFLGCHFSRQTPPPVLTYNRSQLASMLSVVKCRVTRCKGSQCCAATRFVYRSCQQFLPARLDKVSGGSTADPSKI